MRKNFIAGLLIIASVFAVEGCKPKEKKEPDSRAQEWYRYISAYTSGTVSRKAEIRILFVSPAGETGPAAANLFEFKPSLKGAAEWRNPRELVFQPSEDLKPGTAYKAVLQTGRILDLPRSFARFEFGFDVVRPEMEIQIQGLFVEDPARPLVQVIRGRLNTSDAEDPALVQKVLEALQDGKLLNIEWSHTEDRRSHYFTVKDVERRELASAVLLAWNGAPLRIDERGSRTVDVPAQGMFDLVSVEPVFDEARHVLLRFSDVLARNQDLQGLIRIGDFPLTFEIDGNVIRVYSSREFMGGLTVEVSPGIRNYLNRRLPQGDSRPVVFESIHPQVRFVGKGAILPQKDRLTVPIEAVNLKSVQVAAFQIYVNNMAQFFQVNPLQGSEEMTRVGRYLWRKTIPLSDDPAVTGRWSRYDLDVTSLFKENPGSLFRIVLTFNRGNSTYPCPPSDKPVVAEPPLVNQDSPDYTGYSSWDYFEGAYGYGYDGWQNRNNPCEDAYYNPNFNSNARVSRNFIASNIGLAAKLEENGTLHVVTTDILSGRPLPDARVRAYNFQNQLLGESASDGNGFAVLKLADRAFFVSAQSGNDTGYLRINNDSALPMSHFDVGGETVVKGVKGAIYGERGVWRPGDTLFLTFVLFDRDRTLPAGHPVVMEIYSPLGQLVRTLKPAKSVEPFHAFRFATDEAAPTGNWRARVLVGGLTFNKTLKIETVVPNRLKVDFQTGRDILTRRHVPFTATVIGQWLHGAPAANLAFDVTVGLSPRATRFDKFADYAFDDPAREFSGGDVTTGRGSLDAQGQGTVSLDFRPEQPSPGMLEASFTTRIFEESGDFSIDTVSYPYHPYDVYVGIKTPKGDEARGMLLTDQDHVVDIVTVDPSGRPVSGPKLHVSLYKIEWRWWWDRSGESLAHYASSTQVQPLLKGEVATRDGVGRWAFQIKYPEWGRYLIRVEDPEGGHAAGKILYIDWPGWAGRARDESDAAAARLTFTADKGRYQVGEKAVIFLPEAVQGRALVSIENGSSVLQKMWVSTQKGENRFEIPLTRDMTPNVYVHVTLIQPHRDRVSDAPIRLYGVIPIMVDDPATRLEPILQTADEFRPLEKIKIQVREKNARPAVYTLAVVDEGLLGLTRFQTPDLRTEFFRREALGVKTWDLFDEVVGAYGAELARILALGGDESGEEGEEARKPRRFPPVVLFEGPFELKARETATHELEMPQYFGAVRVMVVAGRDGAFGSDSKSVPVRRDLMALPTLPRVVRPGEKIEMPIAVFVTNPSLKNVTVGLETNAMFQIEGESTKNVFFAAPGDQIVSFTLRAADAVGSGEVRFRIRSGSERIEDVVAIPVLGSNPLVTQTTPLEVRPGETLKHEVAPFGLANTNTVTVEASSVPPLNLEKRMDDLIQFPHGCLEQTLSTVLPQLYLKGLLRLDPERQKAIEDNVKAAIDKLGRFQMPNGAFSYWPGDREGHDWTTAYAGFFLLEAARLGYHVPTAMLDKWKANQRMLSNAWTAGPAAQQLIQAFRLYGLASARTPDLGAMNRLRETANLDGTAAVTLAAAFHLTGQPDAAADLAKRADLKVAPYRDDSVTFGSEFRDAALIIRGLVLIGRSDRAKSLLDDVSRVLGSDRWLSTQEAAFGLMAVSSYYGSADIKPFRFRLGWDKEALREIDSAVPFYQQVFADFPAAGRSLAVENPGDSPLYLNIYRRGMPPAGFEQESSNGLALTVRYHDMRRTPIPIDRLSQGLDLLVDIRVKNLTSRKLNNLVLSHLVAAGCQIKNPRFAMDDEAAAPVDYQDFRDDRIYTYFDLEPGAEKTFRVVLNASYRGRYYQPGLAVEAMYEAAVHANTRGQWIEIVR
jgi:alpha-2-macroglobulin